MSNIAIKAKVLGEDEIMMKSYKDFYNQKGYFLTKNSRLIGAKRKPPRFPDNEKGFSKKWGDPNWFVITQKKYLLFLAGFSDQKIITDSLYSSLKSAYDDWNSKYFVVIYGASEASKWACNLFVGEALYLADKTQMSTGKYYSAKQIWNAEGGFKLVDKKDVQEGDIAAFGGHHVEIVTRVRRGQWFEDDEFCSRGAGRGSSGFGTERCDASFTNWFSGSREINDENIKFLRV